MQVQLTLPALERLIAGDNELEVGLRTQIVEQFAEKHLRTLTNDLTWKKAYAEWNKQLEQVVDEKLEEYIIGREASPSAADTIGWKIRDVVHKAVQKCVDDYIKDVVEKQKIYFKTDIQRAVDSAMKVEVNKLVEKEIQRRLDLAKEAK